MKIALAQINTTVGDFDGNVEKACRMIDQACHQGADLILFPELTITGYPPRDLLDKRAFVDKNLKALRVLLPVSERIGILVGHIARNESAGAKPLFNAVSFIDGGEIKYTYKKRLLPSYDVFDEGRYFAGGKEAGVFTFKGVRFGVTICEDIWNDKAYWEEPTYHNDPVMDLVRQDVQILLNLSASPYGWDKEAIREGMIRALCGGHQLPLFFCNLVGGNDELVFDGRSTVVNAKGKVVAEAARFKEDLLIVDESDLHTHVGAQVPIINEVDNVFRALSLGLKDYACKCGFKGAVLGISGGIDSALTAAIAVEALGPEQVVGLIMPSRYTSSESLEDAEQLAANLGIQSHVISIEEVFCSYLETLKDLFGGLPADSTEENLQARIRGNFLMAYSNKHGHLVLSTGNKSELSVGYCTLYGDMSGGLAVISDIPKTMVYRLSEWVNRNKEVIPQRILKKPPSAELKPDQKDQDTLPPYEILDPILKAYVEDHLDSEQIVEQGFDAETVDKVIRMVVANEYKRQQMPLGIKVSKKAFGIGRRLPLAKKV
jgi:NAD+ synthetase